jgi:hypothetical protein
VFIYGLERGELPSFSIREGRIRRVGTGRGLTLRAYIDVISKDVYCGSPVINESKVVIGMVSGNNLLGETEMFTSTDISDLVAQSGLKK